MSRGKTGLVLQLNLKESVIIEHGGETATVKLDLSPFGDSFRLIFTGPMSFKFLRKELLRRDGPDRAPGPLAGRTLAARLKP